MVVSGSSPPSLATAATPPKMPQIAVGWKPRWWKRPEAAMPTRMTVSLPAMIAVRTSRPVGTGRLARGK